MPRKAERKEALRVPWILRVSALDLDKLFREPEQPSMEA